MVIAISPEFSAESDSPKPHVSHAGRLALQLRHHVGQRLHRLGAVHRRLHRLSVEEFAAVGAETLGEEEVHVAGVDQPGAVGLRAVLVGDELADLAEGLPGLRRAEVVAVFGLELLHVRRILEDVLAVVEEVHVAIDDEAVGLAVVGHPVLEGRRDVVELRLHAVLLDVGIERLHRSGAGEVGDPGRADQHHVIGAARGLMLQHLLGEELLERDLVHMHLDAGQLLPFRPVDVDAEHGEEARLLGGVERHAGILLGGLDRLLGGVLLRRRASRQAPSVRSAPTALNKKRFLHVTPLCSHSCTRAFGWLATRR